MMKKFTWGNYLIRLLAAIVLVFATYNPDGYSFYHWVHPAFIAPDRFEVIMAFVGVVIIIAWAIFIRATYRSLGSIGTFLAVAFFATLIWVLVTYTPIAAEGMKTVVYLGLLALAGVLSAGISWSHIRRRMTGQLDVDETDS